MYSNISAISGNIAGNNFLEVILRPSPHCSNYLKIIEKMRPFQRDIYVWVQVK
jgi:hypothetical protein